MEKNKNETADTNLKDKKLKNTLTNFYLEKIKKWMFCPACHNGKMHIDKKSKMWICNDCEYSISCEKFKDNYVFWFCDECNSYLNTQAGFDINAKKHICENCGYENDITINNIKGMCSVCGKILSDSNSNLCEECKLKRKEKTKKWLISAGVIVGAVVVGTGITYLAVKLSNGTNALVPIEKEKNDKIEKDKNNGLLNKIIYTTNEWITYGRQSLFYNQYQEKGQKGDKIVEYTNVVEENTWNNSEQVVECWSIDDPNMPEWLKKYF